MTDLRIAPVTAATFSPAVVIVIPVYKHSALLAEAVGSALAQDLPGGVGIVIVNDGCPFAETDQIATAFALAHANVVYVKKPNGGLSSARNAGIAAALQAFPGFRACYLLDADNRITPNAMRDALALLDADDSVGWIYPNIDKFGIEWAGNYAPPYSKLVHVAVDNICEAGSLVSRKLIDAGVRFDETMRDGYEDWDFWLQAVRAGFVGRNHPHFGFDYRQRAESMLSGSNRMRSSILIQMRKKHRELFVPRNLLALEHEEAPRYALFEGNGGSVQLFTDYTAQFQSLALPAFAATFWSAVGEPESFHVPPFLVWSTAPALEQIRSLRLLHGFFWILEDFAERTNFVAVRFRYSASRIGFQVVENTRQIPGDCIAWAASTSVADAIVKDSSDAWLRSLLSANPQPSVTVIEVVGPFQLSVDEPGAVPVAHSMVATLNMIRTSAHRNVGSVRWNWRTRYLPPKSYVPRLLRQELRAAPVMPRLLDPSRRHIGVVVPVAAFGGVERVAYNFAVEASRRGHAVHLFVVGQSDAAIVPQLMDAFASLNFIARPGVPVWGGAHAFMGHDLALGHDEGALSELFCGMLVGMDVVVNCHSAMLNPHIGRLRESGIRTITWQHVLDRTAFGREVGHPYLTLAYEHAYDLVLTCSEQLADWFNGMGVPSAKVLHVRNAPGYPLAENEVEATLDRRAAVAADRPLQALFLGRLDTQKGIERLCLAIARSKAQGLPVQWQVVGGGVMDGGNRWAERLKALDVAMLDAIYDPASITQLLGDADVLVLPSRWEGAPLVILEAQRLGCVPLATAVGAVDELIADGDNGIVLRKGTDEEIADEIVAHLRQLGEDRLRLRTLAARCAERARPVTWHNNLEELFARIDQWLPVSEASTHKP